MTWGKAVALDQLVNALLGGWPDEIRYILS